MAIEIVENGPDPNHLVLTCEHASNAVPPSFDIPPDEKQWLETHWGWDIGAERVVRALSQLEDATAMLSRFCRLICDPNRRIEQENLVRTRVEGTELSFNQGLGEEEIERRLENFYRPYHRAVDRRLDREVSANDDLFLLSIHSFTPKLGDEERDMEIGVLFDHDQESYARAIAEEIRVEGFDTALNEPYSGKENMIYSVSRHGRQHGVRHVEIEVRNDLIRDRSGARSVARRLARAFRRLPWYGRDPRELVRTG
ncbi:MAG: N-formylglutamate amidohydrolase [Bradymonadaceae bacterium]